MEALLGNKGRPSVNKRRKEEARKQRQALKASRRAERKAGREPRDEVSAGEDPDIAGIVPGPQPLPEDDTPPEEDTAD